MGIISMLKRKGGSGSSTIAAHLAVEYGETFAGECLLIDADPQQSLVRWAAGSDSGRLAKMVRPASGLQDKEFRQVVADAEAEAGTVIIDSPPGLDGAALTAAHLADLIIIPCRPSVLDTDQAGDALRAAMMVKQESAEVAFVPSANLPNTKVGRALPEDLQALGKDAGVHVLPSITHRVGIAAAPLDGSVIQETEPRGGAAKEFAELAEAVFLLVNRAVHQRPVGPEPVEYI